MYDLEKKVLARINKQKADNWAELEKLNNRLEEIDRIASDKSISEKEVLCMILAELTRIRYAE
jgi:hypothetical protein